MRKIQQFYIFKLESSRLKEERYKIRNLSLNDARINSEIVSLANSQLIRTIHKLSGKVFSQEKLNELLDEKASLSRKKNDKSIRSRLSKINELIDNELFIPQLISVHVENKKHYEYLLENNGFIVNGIRFLPLMASSGQIRRNTALFIDEALRDEITRIFNNGRDESKDLVPAKFSAYFSLFSSSTLPVSTPRFAVVSDYVFTAIKRVNFAKWVGERVDPVVEEVEKELEFNGFDGQGLISPEMSGVWADELGIDYIPSWYICRAPYIKGQLVTFDFHEFAEKIAKKKTIVDIYGKRIRIDDIDVLISASQFKLWDSYQSTESFLSHCESNDLGWGITKAAPSRDRNFCKSSYQFLQVLDLKEEDIKEICEPTLNWLRSVSGADILSTLLYLIGDMDTTEEKWFNKLEPMVQAALLNNEMLNDSYLSEHLHKSLSKKKNDGKFGRLLFRGSYQNIIADPFAQASHIFGMELKPLLNDGQHYSHHWNERGVSQVAAIRSPIVHHSEVNVLNFQNRDDVNYWFQFITSGIIMPTNGVGLDFAINGGADVDGDQIATMDHPSFIKRRINDLPIFYDTTKAAKIKITDGMDVYRTHLMGMNQKVGYYTNVSTALYCLLANFEKGSKEHDAILQRLMWGRVTQGLEIDRIKGLTIPPFPEHWVKWKRITDNMTPEEKEQQEFYNRILADRRPMFMLWLYGGYRKKYKKHWSICDNICKTNWRMSFEDLLNLSERTEEQQRVVNQFFRKANVIDNNSPMNMLSKYVQGELDKISLERKADCAKFNFDILLSSDYQKPKKYNIEKMVLLYKEYKSLRREHKENRIDLDAFTSTEQVAEYIRRRASSTISSNSSELADLAVYVCYSGVLGKTSKSFCWNVFGKYIVQNIRSKMQSRFVRLPLLNPTGAREYLFSRYSFYNIGIEEV